VNLDTNGHDHSLNVLSETLADIDDVASLDVPPLLDGGLGALNIAVTDGTGSPLNVSLNAVVQPVEARTL